MKKTSVLFQILNWNSMLWLDQNLEEFRIGLGRLHLTEAAE